MMSPFTPAGDRARWKAIYDQLVKLPVGGTLTYAEIGALLGLDPDADRHKIQMAVRRAAREHLLVDLRSITSVPNVGYQVVETERKLSIARVHQGKAARSVRRGRDHVVNASLDGLDPDTRAVFEAMAWKFSQQDEAIRRLDVRQQRHERQLAAARSAHEQTAEQLADIASRLARLEAERET
jgi:hypothetical protein